MEIKSLKRVAAVSVIALGAAMYAGVGDAATVLSGTANSVNMSGTVLNTIQVDVTPISFGTIGAIAKNANAATATIAYDGTFTDDPTTVSTEARIVGDVGNPASPATITIEAFPDTQLFFTYSVTDDSLQVGGAGNEFVLTSVVDGLNDVTTGVDGTAGGWTTGGGATAGDATTDGNGDLVFGIGATIETEQGSGDFVYPNGTYNLTFGLTISY